MTGLTEGEDSRLADLFNGIGKRFDQRWNGQRIANGGEGHGRQIPVSGFLTFEDDHKRIALPPVLGIQNGAHLLVLQGIPEIGIQVFNGWKTGCPCNR